MQSMKMNQLRHFIILIALIGFIQNGIAQKAATETETYNLCYPDESFPLNNALLTNLMSSLPKVDGKSCITIEATFSFKYKVAASNFRTDIFCDRIEITHPITFQKFELADQILPIPVKFTVQVDDQTKEFKHDLRNNIKVGDILTPDQPQKFNVRITGVEISQDVLSRVVQKQQHISEYYTADTQIKLAFEDLNSINPDSVQYLDRYLDITRKNQAIVKRIKEKELYKKLNLGEHDPLNVYERSNELKKATFEAQSNLTDQSSNLAEEYLRLGEDAISLSDTAKAIEYFDKAIEIDAKLAGAYVEKTKIDFNRKKYIDVIRQSRFISAHTTHHSGNRTDVSDMIKFIENKLVDEAETHNRKEHYQEALVLLDSAETICSSIQIVVCSDMINVARSHSWQGLLYQNIVNWFDVLSRHQYSELPEMVEETFEFRRANNQWLTTNELLYKNLHIIQDSLLAIAETAQQEEPEKALEVLYAAREICNNYVEVPCHNKLDEQFKRAFESTYIKMIEKAEEALADSLPNTADSIQRKAAIYCHAQKIEISDAHKQIISVIAAQRYAQLMQKLRAVKVADKKTITLLDSALTIRLRNGLDKTNDHNFQRMRLLTDYVASLSDKASRMFRAGQIVIATQLLNEIDWVVSHFKIAINDDQQSFINTLREKIGSEACYEKTTQVRIYTMSAETFISKKDFVHAEEAYEKALDLMKKNTGCGFDIQATKKKKEHIDQVAAYQRDLAVMRQFALDNKFQAAIDKHDAIKNSYSDSLLQRHEVEIMPLGKYALNLAYEPFVHYAAKILAQRGYPGESFNLIVWLYKHTFSRELSAPAQQELGKTLAKEFYIKNPSPESAQLY
jgi:tetratricopeptide (TPR) repeat protein